ncbi:hypothetical protein Cha6605_2023 [Chamaesiphon minutus PCC 6605]|uniref:Uncharacterized protein n=1 Tax=Chamaesiphon minutus (strain ATCC 27169 / PCC 6605) TaxID=1173020 RepID=K9UEP2_CHAP6|nr:hypothetical protein Cha6605_2023 [Chamaesiphon minutus PCC 6605]
MVFSGGHSGVQLMSVAQSEQQVFQDHLGEKLTVLLKPIDGIDGTIQTMPQVKVEIQLEVIVNHEEIGTTQDLGRFARH